MNDEEKLEVGLFRYGLIHQLLQEGLQKGERAALMRNILSKTYNIPFSSRTTVGERTIYKYLAWYKEGGFKALLQGERKDAGSVRVIPDEVLKKAFEFKQDVPQRSIREIIEMLELSGYVEKGCIKNSTLSRIMYANTEITPVVEKCKTKTFGRFQKENVNDTWQSDIKHCIYLKDPQNPSEYMKTYLVCFLDDRSRKVCGKIYFQENAANVEDCFRKALIKMGTPGNFYTDNAQVYRTKRLQVICAELGCILKYCRPYSPTSKGKLEKFNSFVDRSFEPEARRLGIKTIDELNEYFEYWLSENYNNKVHSELGVMPNEAHIAGKSHIKYISPEKLREIFIQRQERMVNKAATVSLEGNTYRVEGVLVKKKVELRFDIKDPEKVEVYYGNQRFKDAEPLVITNNVWDRYDDVGNDYTNTDVDRANVKTSYLKLLKDKYEKKLKDRANQLNFKSLYQKEDEESV
jgi:putative transposase